MPEGRSKRPQEGGTPPGIASDRKQDTRRLPKCPTGIRGLDEITGGGLPKGRPTLVCGGAGCGKTLLAMEFLVRGAMQYDEPGVFMAFEETAEELTQNVRSLGFDLDDLADRKKILVDYVQHRTQRDRGDRRIRPRRAVHPPGLRHRLHRREARRAGHDRDALRRPVPDRDPAGGAAPPVPLAQGQGRDRRHHRRARRGALTRHGLEEYVSDCVIVLDHRATEQVSTRRLRIVKYRGSAHGTNEYPFLIDEDGFSVLPITSLGLEHEASDERISTGIARLDAMLGGKGYYRGSSVLVSGTAGTGKTSLAAHFADAACRRGERCLYFAFEESQRQIVRNMRSIGLDLGPWLEAGLLQFHAARPTLTGLEMHLATMHRLIDAFQPRVVIVDPISNLSVVGTLAEAGAMLMRLIDFLKGRQITALFTNLTAGGGPLEQTEVGISSLIDTWLMLRDIELGGERNRGLYILKSRGMAHSNQIREFLLTDRGIELCDVYLGPEGVLTGSARRAQEARERAAALARQQDMERRRSDLERKRRALEAKVAALQMEFEIEEDEVNYVLAQEQAREERLVRDRAEMARSRKADVTES